MTQPAPAAPLPASADVLARLVGLELRVRAIVEGRLAGRHRSPQRGFSVEFAEHREYSPGDDLRYVDWKLFGKRDRWAVKQFEAESNLACVVVVDASESMAYRSSLAPWTKFDCARTAAAALGCLVLRQNDAAGCALVDQMPREYLRPLGGLAQQAVLLGTLESARTHATTERAFTSPAPAPQHGSAQSPGGSSPAASSVEARVKASDSPGIGPALESLALRLPPRSVVVIFTDGLGELPGLLQGLQRLRFDRHDVSLLQVIDPAEEEFPFDGQMLFQGLEQQGWETCDADSVKSAYRDEFARHARELEAGCRALDVDCRRLRTDAVLEAVLGEHLAMHARR